MVELTISKVAQQERKNLFSLQRRTVVDNVAKNFKLIKMMDT